VAVPSFNSASCISQNFPGTMKWYGWGGEGQAFDPIGRPNLWLYAQKHLGIDPARPSRPPVALEGIALPPVRSHPAFRAEMDRLLPPERRSDAPMDRLLHAYGKSTRDLWRIRHGQVRFAPDLVVFPESEDQVVRLLEAARRHDVVVVPFGGGSNVAGCLEVHRPEPRFVLTVNMRGMNRILGIDAHAGTARVQPGIMGPDLEKGLNAAGMTFGHFPDSFPYSTLGGWIATRSSGMLSDRYGNPEDRVLSLRMATPAGMVVTRDIPHGSNGPDPNRICIGSEGTLGILTEVTICIDPEPKRREFRGYIFPNFESGLEAIHSALRDGVAPALTRLNDPDKTQLSSAFRRRGSWWEERAARAFKGYLTNFRAIDFNKAALMITAFEGSPYRIGRQRRDTEPHYWRAGAVALGKGPGESFAEGKFDFPYIRDFLMEHDVIVDVAETSTTWSRLLPLYRTAMATYREALGRDGRPYWLGCHLSHTYPAGASLYFSFAFRCVLDRVGNVDPNAEMGYYAAVKKAGLDCFAAHGATLSHHHAVGYEHLPWLYAESPVGQGTAIDAIKATLDPTGIMNPGKLTVAPRS